MLKVLYNLTTIIFYVPYIFLILIRRLTDKEHSLKFREKIFFNNIVRPKGFLFWFHVASIGELNSILPIVNFYLKKDKKYNFLITTVTLSSFNQLEKKFKKNERVFHQFLPYDLKILVNSFFKNWKPDIVSFVDSEIWPNFILKIKEKKLPFVLLNGRITKKTFVRWSMVKKFALEIFKSFSLCITSNKETAEYLKIFQVNNIKYFGNIKFCSPSNNPEGSSDNDFSSITGKKVWCAVSTHNNEEIFCSKVHEIIKKSEKNIMTIIIPRHINRTKAIYSSLKKMGLKIQIKNENDPVDRYAEIVLVNYYGSVTKYLKSFKQIFIGKSLLKKLERVGGQNPIEAAKMGCYVYHGPYVYNFQEVYDYLDEEGFSKKVDKPEILAKNLIENFHTKLELNKESINKLNVYSSRIFDNVINEYKNLIR